MSYEVQYSHRKGNTVEVAQYSHRKGNCMESSQSGNIGSYLLNTLKFPLRAMALITIEKKGTKKTMVFSLKNSNIMVTIAAKVITFVIANKFMTQEQLLLFSYLQHLVHQKSFFEHTHLAASI